MKRSRDDVWAVIVDVLLELRPEEGLVRDEIHHELCLGEGLDFSSVDAIHLMITLEDRLGGRLGLERLVLRDGEYVGDLALGRLHDFLCQQLGAR